MPAADAVAPTVTIDPASEVGFSTVKVAGKVTPGGSDTNYRFDYITAQQYDENEANDQPPFQGASQAGNGFLEGSAGETTVEPTLEGLTAGTEYHLRLVASNADGTKAAVAPTFTTQTATAPSLAINPASGIGYNNAHLSGTVDPEGGNVNPIGGPVSIDWQLQISQTAGSDSSTVASGTIAGTDAESSSPIEVEADATNLTDATEYHYRLLVSYAGQQEVSAEGSFETADATAPTVTLLPVSDVGPFSVEAHSSINPNGNATIAWFEYSEDGGATWRPAPYFNQGDLIPGPIACKSFPPPTGRPCPPLLEGTSPVPYDATINEHDYNTNFKTIVPLEANSEYLLRVHARNAGGDTISPSSPFKTAPATPEVQALGVDPLAHSASLSGRINPKNNAVSFQFEWGPLSGEGDETYEHVAPATPQPLGPSNNVFQYAAAEIDGLDADTDYHFRLVAIDTEHDVVVKGSERIFSTIPEPSPPQSCPNEASRVGPSAALPDCRAYEWTTPNFNSVAPLPGELSYAEARADGSGILFRTQDAPGNAEGAIPFSAAMARRTPEGWVARTLSPPSPSPLEAVTAAFTYGAVSPDWNEWVVASSLNLSGDRVDGEANFYVHKADGSFQALTEVGGPFRPENHEFPLRGEVTQASADFSHIYFLTSVPQFPSDPSVLNLYEWSDGELRLTGIMPAAGPGEEELPAPYGAQLAAGGALPAMSADGDEALFVANTFGSNGIEPGLFLRIDGQETIDVARSQRSPEDPNPRTTVIAGGITPDGDKVFFTSKNELTDDAHTGETEGASTDAGANLYSYDVESGELTDLTVATDPADAERGADVKAIAGVSEDGSYVYFTATGKLAPGAISGDSNLYVWHAGEIEFISSAAGLAELAATEFVFPYRPEFFVTPDGRSTAFLSRGRLGPYDNEGHAEVYTYDYGESVSCASCPADGEPPIGDAVIRGRTLSDDGSRVFFETDQPLVPEATNGLSNAYEYSEGEHHLLSPGGGKNSYLMGASASGDDVFVGTFEELTPNNVGDSFAIYDARVGAEVPPPPPPPCKGESCREGGTAPPTVAGAGSGGQHGSNGIGGPGSKQGRSGALKLRLTVPGAGQVKVQGKQLKAVTWEVKGAGSVTVTVALKPGPNGKRLAGRTIATKARVSFKAGSGESSKIQVALKFLGTSKKGGK